MDARSNHTTMSYNNNGFVEEQPVFYPPGRMEVKHRHGHPQ